MKTIHSILLTLFPLLILNPLFSIDTLYCIAHFEHIPPTTMGSNMTPVILGDINADGYDDWAFKYRDRNIWEPSDSVWIFLGSDSISLSPDYAIQTRELANVGDINGDGYDDLAYLDVDFYLLEPLAEPIVRILYGGPDFDLIPDDSCEYINTKKYRIYYDSFKKIGDINGDGYDDLLCGAREYQGAFLTKRNNSQDYEDIVKLQVYLGGENVSWHPDTTIIPPVYLSASDALGYAWYNCTGLGDINYDGYDDFSMQYFEIRLNDYGFFLCDSVTYVYYGSSSLTNIANSVDTFFVGDINAELGSISDSNQKSYFCKHKDTLNQIPGLNIVYANDINTPEIHYNSNNVGNASPGDINGDGYNDWIIWDKNENKIKGYFGGSVIDNNIDFTTPDDFHFNGEIGYSIYGEKSQFYILGDICGDGYDKVLFVEKIDDQYYDLYFFSYNDIKSNINDMVPQEFNFLNIYPNPFNSNVTIEYDLMSYVNVDISIHDVNGKFIKNIVSGPLPAGNYKNTFNAAFLSSGVYFCTLKVDNKILLTEKLLLMK